MIKKPKTTHKTAQQLQTQAIPTHNAGHQALLIEIGTEDLPAKALPALEKNFSALMQQAFADQGLTVGQVDSYSTPRRLALCIQDFPQQEPDVSTLKRGPSLAAAYDADGNPTPAALAFAKSVDTALSKLSIQETPKGKWLVCSCKTAGRPITVFLPELLTQVLDKLPMNKRMRWGEETHTFLRPIHSITLLFGNTPIVGRVYGLTTHGQISGHRSLHPGILPLSNPQDYAGILEKQGFVIADAAKRQRMIREKIAEITRAKKMEAILDDDLVEEVTGLVEYPEILIGHFSPDFLKLPREALITAMQVHQRCFPCQDAKGKLLPYFIIVSNLISKDSKTVIRGNERVMQARLQDAVFHFEQDLKTPLSEHNKGLSQIVFQTGLGSLLDKTRRIMYLSRHIAQDLGKDKAFVQTVERAAELCKADLLTQMVSEFPELQGIMGKYYAQLSGETAAVSDAIEAHYLPRFAQDKLPDTLQGSIVSLADRIDSLVGLFGIGKVPTGDKDPFALRRQAAGILRICIENELDVDLNKLTHLARDSYGINFADAKVVDKVLAFLMERFKTLFQENQLPLPVFDAVSDRGMTHPLDLWRRAQALTLFLNSKEAEPLIAANKRVKNILAKQHILPLDPEALAMIDSRIDASLLKEPSEKTLVQALQKANKLVSPLVENRDYQAALVELSKLQKPVDDFFETVMVIDKHEAIKNNRLHILQALQLVFNSVANVSVL